MEVKMSKINKSGVRNTMLGMAVGTGAMLYRDHLIRKHPLSTPAQLRISRSLDRTLSYARLKNTMRLDENSRFVIFSDHHKGAKDTADDFHPCEITYQTALDYYYENGFTLILLGDVEELWENPIQPVMDSYENIFLSEQRFYPDRYIRVIGNHDDAWNDPNNVARYLEPFYPKIRVQQGLVFEYDNSKVFGELFLAHGHQGTLDSDYLSSISPQILPTYRQLQNKFHIGRTTPATDDYLRGEHDTQMYRWASRNRKLIFIAGHTHRPVWTSLTHLDQLYMQLYALRSLQKYLDAAEYDKQHQDLLYTITKRITKFPPVNDTLKTSPCYFNTGCCRFSDGDITGLEITGDTISLVKWDRSILGRQETISMPLNDLFAMM
jgi:predicted phosphodiesterase